MMLSEIDIEGIGMEEHVGSCNNDATNITKGKRTKRRLKLLSPCAVTVTAAMTSSCSSASGGGDYGSFSSTTTTFEGTDQEEEDMAHCLILLAQGREIDPYHRHHKQQVEEDNNKKMTERGMATKIGFECKTCNRTFPSFQALGGHRASHKKPKVMMTQEEKKSPPLITNNTTCEFEERKQIQMKIGPMVSLELGCGNTNNRGGDFFGNNNKSKTKIHECSICGSEFTSGQALGGHMRRHRASTNNSAGVITAIQTTCDAATDVDVKPRNVLELDLNLPAPEDDLRDSKFQFPVTPKPMVLSAAPALVGCHY